MMKDKKERQCINRFCKKTLTTNKKVPICDSCRKKGRDWTFGILGTVASVVVLEKQINKDK